MNSFVKNFFSSALGSLVGVFVALFFAFIVLPLAFTALLAGAKGGRTTDLKTNSILHLKLRGQIVEKHRPLDFEIFGERSIFTEDRTMGLYELNKAIAHAKTDKKIAGIFLEIHDFDAGWAAVTSLRRSLDDFAKGGKWIQAYADRLDEKGFLLASAANQISMEPHGELEFNGLEITEAFLKGLLDKLDLEPRIFRVGKFKAAVEPITRSDMSPENKEQTQALVGDLWQTTRDSVAKSLKLEGQRLDDIAAKLEVTSAESAQKAGLIHKTAFIDEVEDKMKEFTVGKDKELELVSPGAFLRTVAEQSSKSGKKVAVIFAEGEIGKGESGRDHIGSEGLREEIIAAREDEDVQAIVLRINSPGGDALASDVLWREVRMTDDELPVVISMGDYAASGGYYIAAGGRYIFAEPTTITGSIGVFGIMFGTEKFLKTRTGVNFDRVVTHPYADIGAFTRPMSPFESQKIQAEVDRVYKRFLDVVEEGRGYEKRKDLETIAEGRVWSGLRAKEIGLVDELGGLDQAIKKAAEFAELGEDYEVELVPGDEDPLRQLLEKMTGEALISYFGPSVEKVKELTGAIEPLKSGVHARLLKEMRIR